MVLKYIHLTQIDKPLTDFNPLGRCFRWFFEYHEKQKRQTREFWIQFNLFWPEMGRGMEKGKATSWNEVLRGSSESNLGALDLQRIILKNGERSEMLKVSLLINCENFCGASRAWRQEIVSVQLVNSNCVNGRNLGYYCNN